MKELKKQYNKYRRNTFIKECIIKYKFIDRLGIQITASTYGYLPTKKRLLYNAACELLNKQKIKGKIISIQLRYPQKMLFEIKKD